MIRQEMLLKITRIKRRPCWLSARLYEKITTTRSYHSTDLVFTTWKTDMLTCCLHVLPGRTFDNWVRSKFMDPQPANGIWNISRCVVFWRLTLRRGQMTQTVKLNSMASSNRKADFTMAASDLKIQDANHEDSKVKKLVLVATSSCRPACTCSCAC